MLQHDCLPAAQCDPLKWPRQGAEQARGTQAGTATPPRPASSGRRVGGAPADELLGVVGRQDLNPVCSRGAGESASGGVWWSVARHLAAAVGAALAPPRGSMTAPAPSSPPPAPRLTSVGVFDERNVAAGERGGTGRARCVAAREPAEPGRTTPGPLGPQPERSAAACSRTSSCPRSAASQNRLPAPQTARTPPARRARRCRCGLRQAGGADRGTGGSVGGGDASPTAGLPSPSRHCTASSSRHAGRRSRTQRTAFTCMHGSRAAAHAP